MIRDVLHSKIHMATVTQANPDYVGSITIDQDLLRASGMRVSDKVLVANCRNGNRFETYVFLGEAGSGTIGLNGAAAHLVEPGDKVIIIHWCALNDDEYATHHPTVVLPTADNRVDKVLHYDPGP
ncbi:MAG: aspartate 1-decarboxylase [Planctomycetota bacterium]